MKEFSVRKYESKDYKVWNEFVNQAYNATFLFHRDFIEYHKNRFQDYSLIIEDNKGFVALLPANTTENQVFSHQGLTYGGLISLKPFKLEQTITIMKVLLEYLSQQGKKVLQVKQLPTIYPTKASQEIEYVFFVLRAKIMRRDALSVVDLQQNLNLSKGRKEGVKRGVKNELIVKEENNFTTFWNQILLPNLEQKYQKKPVHSLEEITLLKQKFPSHIRQFNVYKNEELVAGTTIFETENVAHAQYISANSDKSILGSLDFLYYELLTKFFAYKPYFDFGISNENQGQNINQGLSYWKESFGCFTVIQDFYELETANYSLLENVLI